MTIMTTWKERFDQRWPGMAFYVCTGTSEEWYKAIYLKWDAEEK